MKKIYLVLLASLVVVSCEKFDGEGFSSRLDKVESDGEALKGEIAELSESKAALEARIVDLDAVTSVDPYITEDEREGYKISFVKSEPIIILDGKDGKDGEQGEAGAPGEDGDSFSVDGYNGATGDKGAAGKDAYVSYTETDTTVTIKLWNAKTEKYEFFTLDKVASASSDTVVTPAAPFMTLGDGSALLELSDDEALKINLPDDLKVADYKAIIVEVVSEDASGSNVVTKAEATPLDGWKIKLTKPTFDKDGVYEKNAEVSVCYYGEEFSQSGIITVTFIAADGSKEVARAKFEYVGTPDV